MQRTVTVLVLALVLAAFAAPALAERDADVRRLPGYVDLESIEVPRDAEELREIDLGPDILAAAARDRSRQDDELVASLLSGVQAIRVKSFSLDTDADARAARRDVERIEADLERRGWRTLVTIRDAEELVSVRMVKDGEMIAGLMVIVFDPHAEVTFANIVGHLDLASIAGLAMGTHDVDLEELLEDIGGYEPKDRDDRERDRDDRDKDR